MYHINYISMKHIRSRMFTIVNAATIATVSTLILFVACNDGNGCIDGSGAIITVEKELEPFHSVITGSVFDVLFEQGAEQQVLIEGQQNIIDDITTEVSDGIWLISLTGTCYNNLDIVIHITLPTIKSIESTGSDRVILNSFDSLETLGIFVSGSGRFFQSGTLNVANKLTLQSTGSGEMTANFNSTSVEALMSGSGDMTLSGATIKQTVAVAGSGNYFAFALNSDTCAINNSGSGNAEVFVDSVLDVIISGSGNVSYQGNPKVIESITGSGQLINAN